MDNKIIQICIIIKIKIIIATIIGLAPVLNSQGRIHLYYIILQRNLCALLISLNNYSASYEVNPVTC